MNEYIFDGVKYRFFNHLYAVSKCGKILRYLQPYSPHKRADGYMAASNKYLVHRMVALCWLPKPENANLVHHLNRDKTDNRAANLEWITPKEHLAERHIDHTANIGKYKRTESHRDALRNARKGKKTSAATKAKQRAALLGRKRPFIKRAEHTQEWKDQMSLTHHKNAACEVNGKKYRSFAEASRDTGIHRFTIRKRCLSENFPDYKIIPIR
jgi:hypothetical protein